MKYSTKLFFKCRPGSKKPSLKGRPDRNGLTHSTSLNKAHAFIPD